MKLPEATTAFESVEPGTYLAVCFAVIDLGTHQDTYEGETRDRHQLMIQWELPDELMPDNTPAVVSKWYTFSMNEKATLRLDLEAWRGKKFTEANLGPDGDFEIDKLLGVGCMVSIVEKQGGKGTKTGSIMKLPKGVTAPKPVNATELFDLSEPDREVYDRLSDYKKSKIAESREWAALNGKKASAKKTVVPDAPSGSELEDDESPF